MKILKHKIAIALMAIVLGIFILTGCGAPKYNYLGEKITLHGKYEVTVTNVRTLNEITVKTKAVDEEGKELNPVVYEDTTKTGDFIAVDVKIVKTKLEEKTENGQKVEKTHTLDSDDFLLKDHTGFKISKVWKKDQPNEVKFGNTKAVEDYTWLGQEVKYNETLEFTLYFATPETGTGEAKRLVNPLEDFAAIEIDFQVRTGKDIVLTYDPEKKVDPKTTTKETTTENKTTTAATTTQAGEPETPETPETPEEPTE